MTRDRSRPPAALTDDARVAVIAGNGALPANVIDELLRKGHRPFVVAIEGELDAAALPPGLDFVSVSPERIGTMLPRLKREGITHLVMAGGVTHRPSLAKLRLGLGFLVKLPRLLAFYAKGDDGLLRGIIEYVEDNGIAVVGAHDIAPDLLAPEGLLTRARPTAGDWKDIRAATHAAKAIGALDVGQAAIAVGGRAIELEGIEGTDGLLRRVKDIRDHGRLGGRKRGVLVKCAKPKQELRADLPAIGPETIAAAHSAGLAGVAVEAGRSLILDFDSAIRQADTLGLFVVGLSEDRDG